MSVKVEDDEHMKDEDEDDEGMGPIVRPADDEYGFEDTGELEIPPEPQSTWLLRIPKMIHEQWAHLDENEEVVIGCIRKFKKTGQSRLVLNHSMTQHNNIPREYDIYTTDDSVNNTYVFSEKDLPGYKKGARHKKPAQTGDRPAGPKPDDKVDKTRRFQKAIPKQTALKGIIRSEANCTAVDSPETRNIMKMRAEKEKTDKPPIEFKHNATSAESVMFRVNREKIDAEKHTRGAAVKAKVQENKTARMPRNELLDALYECFSQFTWWSMKALRDRLRQPEAYLKENLESIAELARSGPQTGHYRLRPEAQRQNFNLNEDLLAPEDSQLEDMSGLDDGDAMDDDPE